MATIRCRRRKRCCSRRRVHSENRPERRTGAGALGDPMNTALMFSTGKDDWQTPPELFARLDAEFNFYIDGAASQHNTLCSAYYGPDSASERLSCRDALIEDWAWHLGSLKPTRAVYVNPPYSRGLQGKFIAKAASERRKGVTTVMLLPARTDTRAFHDHIWDEQKHQPREGVEVRFLRGRLRFIGAPASAPFPSMIVIFRGATR